MVTDANRRDVVAIGRQFERKAFEFYSMLAKKAKHKPLAELFQWLSGQEKRHEAAFDALAASLSGAMNGNPYQWKEMLYYFRSLLDTNVFNESDDDTLLSSELDNEIGAIQIAISFEKENILFFQRIAECLQQRERNILDELIEEEKVHILKLLDIKHHIVEQAS